MIIEKPPETAPPPPPSPDFAELLASMTFLPCPTCTSQTPARRFADGTYRAQRCEPCTKGDEDAARVDDAIARAQASIPALYRWSHFTAPELRVRVSPPEAIATARALFTRTRITIVGQAGSGKTSLAVAILRERSKEARMPGIFVHAYRLGVARIQHKPGQGEAPSVEEAMHAKVALIDDIGNERPTANNAVPDVIFERHSERMPTIVTTGFDAEGIAKLYGDGIARRVFEGAAVIKLGGAT